MPQQPERNTFSPHPIPPCLLLPAMLLKLIIRSVRQHCVRWLKPIGGEGGGGATATAMQVSVNLGQACASISVSWPVSISICLLSIRSVW